MPRVTGENINELQRKILKWYGANARKFLWRKERLTNYKIIIAETLVQRTKAETFSKFYKEFIIAFPNWKSLANAKLQRLEEYLTHIGLQQQRDKRFQNLSVEKMKRNGKLPIDREQLESIPFIGQYIANAIELIIYKKASPLIDVSMSRVFERNFRKRKMADIRYDPYLQKLSFKVVNHPKTKEINWAILYFTTLICKAQIPNC